MFFLFTGAQVSLAQGHCAIDGLRASLDAAEAAFSDLDAPGFEHVRGQAEDTLHCLEELITPDVCAKYHLVQALNAFLEEGEERSVASFASLLAILPTYELPLELAPAEHRLREWFDAARAQPEGPMASDLSGFFSVDGAHSAKVPLHRPYILQRYTAAQELRTKYVLPEAELPGGSPSVSLESSILRGSTVSARIDVGDADVTKWCGSPGGMCTPKHPFQPEVQLELPPWVVGPSIVTWWTADATGVLTGPMSEGVLRDRQAPQGGVLRGAASPHGVTLVWSGFRERHSHIREFVLLAAEDVPPRPCAEHHMDPNPVCVGRMASCVHHVVRPGLWRYRVCAVDAAGLVSEGAVASVNIPEGMLRGPEIEVPTNIVADTTTFDVDTLDQAYGCQGPWVPCQSFVPVEDGWLGEVRDSLQPKLFRIWVASSEGMLGPTVGWAVLDADPPEPGKLKVAPDLEGYRLSWGNFEESETWIDGFEVYASQGETLAACGTPDPIYQGLGQTFLHEVERPSRWRYRVCARDAAGNLAEAVQSTFEP